MPAAILFSLNRAYPGHCQVQACCHLFCRAAEVLAKEGIKVIQDKCLLVEHMHAAEAAEETTAKRPVKRGVPSPAAKPAL